MLNLTPFKLERYFARYEFAVEHLLSSSDCDGWRLNELLRLADDETRRLWDDLALGYTESQGHPLLREEIARLYTGITPADCLAVVPEEGIFIALNAVLRPGDHAVCTFPGYQSLYEVAAGLGCQVTRWLPHEQNGWRFDPADLAAAMQPNTRLIIVNFPHNPTGVLPSLADFDAILAIARQHNACLFSDEMYRWLEHDPRDRLPAACEMYERGISLCGMSKTFGMAGARVGWVITRDRDVFSRMTTLKDYTTICGAAPSEILAMIALRARQTIINRHLTRIRRNLALLDGFFTRHAAQFRWVRPTAATIAFPRLTGAGGSLAFCQRVVEQAGVLLLPSTVYDYGDQHFRLGFGRENMPEALARLEAYLQHG
ncbi:MAG: aminotransferase class I/II-fold pyridoxal phosphate-dependent enzyme [Chloroflexota bacterium]